MIVFNIPGLLMAVTAFALAYPISGWATGDWHGDNAVNFFVLGIVAVGLDVGYRCRKTLDLSAWRFVRPGSGGHILFIPLWMLGTLWIVMGVKDVVTGQAQVRTANDSFMQEITLLEKTTTALQGPEVANDGHETDDLLKRSRDRIRKLADFYSPLERSEKSRLDRKYGARINGLIEQIRLRSVR